MTDELRASLLDSIKGIVAKIPRFKDRRIGEQNTKAALIEPILKTLGWDVSDPDEVHQEFKPTSRDNPVDYALKLMRAPRLFVEAKGLGENLSDRKWVAQMLGYAAVAGVEWCVLTDGDEYRFYNATAPIDAADKLFCSVMISRDPEADVIRVLELMSRGNLQENSLERLWKAHFVDRRVQAAVKALIEHPEGGLVNLLRRTTKNLKPKDIVESLRRLDIQIAAPSPFQEPRAVAQPTDRRSTKAGAKAKAPPQTAGATTRTSTTLSDLIAAGILRPPLPLFRRYKNHMLEATLQDNGAVSFNGKEFDSCSTAAELARGSVMGRRMNTNGWTFWCFNDGAGKRLTLDDARRALTGKRSGPSSK